VCLEHKSVPAFALRSLPCPCFTRPFVPAPTICYSPFLCNVFRCRPLLPVGSLPYHTSPLLYALLLAFSLQPCLSNSIVSVPSLPFDPIPLLVDQQKGAKHHCLAPLPERNYLILTFYGFLRTYYILSIDWVYQQYSSTCCLYDSDLLFSLQRQFL
jgi:hypothetical protein